MTVLRFPAPRPPLDPLGQLVALVKIGALVPLLAEALGRHPGYAPGLERELTRLLKEKGVKP